MMAVPHRITVGNSSDEDVEPIHHATGQEVEQAEQTASGAQASTSTSVGPSLDAPDGGEVEAPPQPLRDVDTIPSLPTTLGPMPYTNFYDDGPGGFTNKFWENFEILEDVLVEKVTGDRITLGTDFITLPLFAIIEGGVRNPTYDKYYLTTRQGFDHLMDCLYDTEKWANVLVRVSWNFGWGPVDSLLDFPYRTRHDAAMERPYNIPLLRRFLGSGEVLGRVFLFLFAEFFYVILVFAFFFCLALLLRIHTFTFVLTASRRTRAFTSPGGQEKDGEEGSRPCQCYRQEQDQPPTAGTTQPPPIEQRGLWEAGQRAEKRAKTAEDKVEITGATHASEHDAKPEEPSAIFELDFTCPDAKPITVVDSLLENQHLAMTLLNGLAFPKDVELLQRGKADNMAKLCYYAVEVGQCTSRAYDDIDSLLDLRRSLRGELKAEKAEAQEAADKVQRLIKSVAEAADRLVKRERLLKEVKDLKEEKYRLLGERDQAEEEMVKRLEEAGDSRYNEAGKDYANQLSGLISKAFKEGEVKGVRDTHRRSFLLGYQVGLDYVEFPKDDHRREQPVVPEVELPSHLLSSEQPDPNANNDDAAPFVFCNRGRQLNNILSPSPNEFKLLMGCFRRPFET
ncbi:hypothetical protein RHSIM_Rhsim01G0168800 [Rhododendron simsii]|uniref:Uncharacterized protein n=1 Tax=Rhododendron simsii TaxID=118357 RepID=A0A834LW83_RHOSS|nr:hypothetical protein RHSIM_Rhsim01G0168800 [Rhododendron simsii]